MINLYEDIRSKMHYHKFAVGDLLFAEYTCPIQQRRAEIWAETDYLVHVVSGKKVWHTHEGAWSAVEGQTWFFRKGGAVVEQFFDHDFCLLLFFLPDAFIREVVRELGAQGPQTLPDATIGTAVKMEPDVGLTAFLQSMMAYFSGRDQPSEVLLRLKLKELITSLLVGQANPALAGYLSSVARDESPSVKEIMESNFRFRLSLEEFAKLCHRSLSSFKRDFRRQFGEPPGKWLLARRLEYAAARLRSGNLSITELAFESGFEEVSHFSRAFRTRFGSAPSEFRRAP